MPCHHSLDAYLNEYLDAAEVTFDPKASLFRSIQRRSGRLSERGLAQPDAYRMIQRRALAAGL